MSKKWASYTFSLFLKHEMSYTSQGRREKTSPKPLVPMDGRGIKDLHKCGEEMSKNFSLPSQEQQEQVSWMALAGEREGDKGAKEFCPGWRHQPEQKGGLLSRLVAPTGTKACAGLLSRLESPTGIKGHPFVSVGASNRDKGLLSPPPSPGWPLDPGQKPPIVPGPKAARTNVLEQKPVL